jgi:signal transduction histidine kinase
MIASSFGIIRTYSLLTELNHEKRISCLVTSEGRIEDVGAAVLLELNYIGREAISNAFRHAGASEITFNLKCEPKCVTLTIADNGREFDLKAQAINAHAGHWGLRGMKERAETIGAVFECRGAEMTGTKVIVTVSGTRAYAKPSGL